MGGEILTMILASPAQWGWRPPYKCCCILHPSTISFVFWPSRPRHPMQKTASSSIRSRADILLQRSFNPAVIHQWAGDKVALIPDMAFRHVFVPPNDAYCMLRTQISIEICYSYISLTACDNLGVKILWSPFWNYISSCFEWCSKQKLEIEWDTHTHTDTHSQLDLFAIYI